jgi:transcriptional regulator with XRE-family HTH domain
MTDSEPCPFCGTQLGFKAMPFAMRVTFRRKRLGMTQEALAKAVGQDRATIANIETGRHKISFDMIRTYAKALQISVEELVP